MKIPKTAPRKTTTASNGANMLLSGTSLVAASALLGAGRRDFRASAATGAEATVRETAEHRRHHG